MISRKPLSMILAFAFLFGTLPVTGSPTLAQSGPRTFPETGKTVSGRFLEYWDKNGSLEQQGFPISEPMQETSNTDGKVYTVQYFERSVFEAHPENPKPYDVLLSLLGVFYYNEKYGGNAPGQRANPDNPRLFTETGKTIGGAFRQYWESHGGLAQQGFPISDEFREISPTDGKEYTVQYFQRAVFEFHPELSGTSNMVLLSLLGVFFYDRKHNSHPPTATPKPGASPTPTPSPSVAPPSSAAQVLFYNTQIGSATVGRIDTNGNYSDQKKIIESGAKGWSHIVPIGNGRLLWYDKVGGLTSVGKVASDGQYTDIRTAKSLTPGFTQLAWASNNMLVYYSDVADILTTAEVYDDGTISYRDSANVFGADWTHVVGLSNGRVLFYHRGSNQAGTFYVDNMGKFVEGKQLLNWDANWDLLVSGPNGLLLQYEKSTGRAAVVRIDDAGNETPLAKFPDPATGAAALPQNYPIITALSNSELFFFDPANRSGVTARMSNEGKIEVQERYDPNSFAPWSHIVGLR